jgi:hypothetical protein
MTREALKELTDAQLQDIGVWVLEETRERREQRTREAITKIKAIAAEHNIPLKPEKKGAGHRSGGGKEECDEPPTPVP